MPRTSRPAPSADTALVASNLRMYLAKIQMTRSTLATQASDAGHPISAAQISRYAAGQRAMTVDDLRPVASALGVNVADLLEGVL